MSDFNAAEDAQKLKQAMAGLGTRDTVLIDIIGHRSRPQRQTIVDEYSRSVGGDLIADLQKETSGHYREVLLNLMKPRDEMLADLIYEATNGKGTCDGVLIDIMTQFPYELPAIAAAFEKKYRKTLETVLRSETTGSYEEALVALLNTPRPPPNKVDAVRAAKHAEAFFTAGEGRAGTNEHLFITIITSNSYEQLNLIEENYRSAHQKSLEDAIKAEASGHFRDVLLACITPSDKYFASRVKQAVDGVGTDDLSLITAFVANERPQLQKIAKAYETMFGKPMSKRVAEDTTGDYERILLALLE